MKNLFLKFLIVPHGSGKKRWVKLPIFFLLLVVLILALTGFFFWNNFQRYVNISSIVFLKTDNKMLEEKIKLLQEKRDYLKSSTDSLLKVQEKTLEKHNITQEEPKIVNMNPPDTLLILSRWVETVLKTSLKMDSVLKKLPSIKPVEGYIIKPFGRQIDPYTGKEKPHNGVDILTSLNSPVVSTADGTVKKVDHEEGKGLYVEVAHWNNFITLYGHLLSTVVKEGALVKRGDILGYVGQSGKAPYPYLYYEVRKDSVILNPVNVIFGGI